MTQLSGTYQGLGRDVELILRLDVDGPTALNMLSGEINQSIELKDFNYLNLRQHSFIGDDISCTQEGNRSIFTTPIRFFRLPELTGTITVEIDPSSAVARLKLTGYGYHRQPLTFALDKTSDYFRDIRLEIDFEKGTEVPEPYEAWRAESHPAGMPEEPISIQGAFQRSGIDVVVHPDHTAISGAAGADGRWTSAELHAAMTNYFSLISTDPTWNVYLLIGMQYVNPGVSGIMFDSGDPLPRQGAAVFYSHFKDLPDGIRQRNYMRTTVHELGHAFNLLHSFQKGVFSEFGFGDNPFMMPRSNALSYMNYPWRYPHGHNRPPGWNGAADYWARFPFAFERTELMHLRHHDRLEVAFGGEAFGIHGHSRLSALQAAEIAECQRTAPLKLSLRAKQVKGRQVTAFDHMEPVHLELKLESSGQEEIDTRLDPAAGLVAVYVQKPNGEITKYRPLMTACGEQPELEILQPGLPLYQDLHLTFGRDGFHFQEPGIYEVRAVYLGGERQTTYSNALRLNVAPPKTRERELLAADFFDPVKGQLLAVGPSASSQFSVHLDFFRDMAAQMPETAVGRYLAGYLGMADGVPFKDVGHTRIQEQGVPVTTARMSTSKPKPEAALKYLDAACKATNIPAEDLGNLYQARLGLCRARVLEAGGDAKAAKAAVDEVKKFVALAIADNKPVRERELARLDDIKEKIGGKETPLAAIAA